MKILPESYFKANGATPISDVDEVPTRSVGKFDGTNLINKIDYGAEGYKYILHYLTPEDEVFDQRFKYNIARVGLYKDWNPEVDAFVKHEEDFIAFYDVSRTIRCIIKAEKDTELLIDEDNALIIIKGDPLFFQVFIIVYAKDITLYSHDRYGFEMKYTLTGEDDGKI
jgi:hypothetical protein